MKHAIRTILTTLLVLFSYITVFDSTKDRSKLLTFDDLKHFISYYESSNGRYKFNKTNKNGTVDCGVYQVNSSHFTGYGTGDKEVTKGCDSIFQAYQVSKRTSERIVKTIQNDELCEALARFIYSKRGINAWSSYKKFKPYLEGYYYYVYRVPTLRKSHSTRRKPSINKGIVQEHPEVVSKEMGRKDKGYDVQSADGWRSTNAFDSLKVSF